RKLRWHARCVRADIGKQLRCPSGVSIERIRQLVMDDMCCHSRATLFQDRRITNLVPPPAPLRPSKSRPAGVSDPGPCPVSLTQALLKGSFRQKHVRFLNFEVTPANPPNRSMHNRNP